MWKIENDEDSAGGAVFVCKENSATFLNDVLFRTYDEPLADVVVDALNVHEATGLTPSQLQSRVAELEGALAASEKRRIDLDDTIHAIFRAVGYTAEYAMQWPKEKMSVTFARWFDEQVARGEGIAAPAAPAPAQEHATQLAGVDDLAQLVKQLVHSLRKAAPSHALPEKALDYMRRQGLLGSPLRTASYTPSTPAGLLAAAAHIQAKACAYAEECGSYDPDTGAFEMCDAAQDHYNTLNELAEEIRLMADEAAPAQAQDAVAVREVLGK